MIRYFNVDKRPLPAGSTGPYQLDCPTEQDWNDSGGPDRVKWDGDVPRFLNDGERAAILRLSLRDIVDRRTDSILNTGMDWLGFKWKCDKIHFDDYRDACQQIQLGLATEILIHGVGENAYVTLNASNVTEFFTLGRAFKLDSMFDGYKIKDLGGELSTGVTVKALKDMTYQELLAWTDPR